MVTTQQVEDFEAGLGIKAKTDMLTPAQRWRIERLTEYGYSHKFIASRAFNIPMSQVKLLHLRLVANMGRRLGMKVSDWRNGRSRVAKDTARDAVKPRRRKRRQSA